MMGCNPFQTRNKINNSHYFITAAFKHKFNTFEFPNGKAPVIKLAEGTEGAIFKSAKGDLVVKLFKRFYSPVNNLSWLKSLKFSRCEELLPFVLQKTADVVDSDTDNIVLVERYWGPNLVSIGRKSIEKKSSRQKKRFKKLFIFVSDQLELAHKNGLVLRDLKPENITAVVKRSDIVRAQLIDWSLATSLGRASTYVGTTFTTDPNVLARYAYGRQSTSVDRDIFALLITMLCFWRGEEVWNAYFGNSYTSDNFYAWSERLNAPEDEICLLLVEMLQGRVVTLEDIKRRVLGIPIHSVTKSLDKFCKPLRDNTVEAFSVDCEHSIETSVLGRRNLWQLCMDVYGGYRNTERTFDFGCTHIVMTAGGALGRAKFDRASRLDVPRELHREDLTKTLSRFKTQERFEELVSLLGLLIGIGFIYFGKSAVMKALNTKKFIAAFGKSGVVLHEKSIRWCLMLKQVLAGQVLEKSKLDSFFYTPSILGGENCPDSDSDSV